jgi:hypothetical protein
MSNLKEATTNTVAKINNTEIVVIENGEKRVAIKPICEALGIAFEPQFTKLKNDPLLNSVVMLSVTTGADGKRYEMTTIPFKYVFGWLFRIDSRNVKPEAKEAVERYQLECYDALYNHFTRQSEFLKARQYSIDEQIEIVDQLRSEFKNAERAMFEARNELNRRRGITFEQWMADQSQLSIFTAKEMEG